jgi:polyhydroxybutyrate depolymerase
MRTPVSLHRYLVLPMLGCTLALACGEDATKNDGTGGASGSAGESSGGTSSGGASSGGTGGSATGGDQSGGDAGVPSTGGDGTGGTEPGTGGTSAGTGEGGTTSGGNAGSATGGNAGSGGTAGNAGSGGAGTPSGGCRAGGSPTSGRFTIDVGGTQRDYIIKLPADYDPMHPYRLVLAFHGRMYDAQSVADGGPPGSGPYYGIEALAGGSTIFVAPQALSTSWTDASGRDVAYVNAMVARFKAELCIDESRIFATGFSMGAIMTITLGCDSDGTFRAIAPMSGSLPASCDGERSMAYWASHGTDDMTIRIAFLTKNGCSMATTPGDRAGCVNYQNCDEDAPVTWCTFTGVHEPPPYAGEAIWAFLSQF